MKTAFFVNSKIKIQTLLDKSVLHFKKKNLIDTQLSERFAITLVNSNTPIANGDILESISSNKKIDLWLIQLPEAGKTADYTVGERVQVRNLGKKMELWGSYQKFPIFWSNLMDGMRNILGMKLNKKH
eukprot:TRINITY_DN4276_c0_g1_i1.p1 TRINITY_DN4276_c0_g1~~TRINITY_DN4276_c0_g1_i1.p1  ORF type:complete len:140 (+),score=16.25 TRINITY_DN4276_c0_g1_i1:37-420(+)